MWLGKTNPCPSYLANTGTGRLFFPESDLRRFRHTKPSSCHLNHEWFPQLKLYKVLLTEIKQYLMRFFVAVLAIQLVGLAIVDADMSHLVYFAHALDLTGR